MVSCHVLILSAAFSFAMAASPSTTTATTATSIPASALPSLVAELPACTAGCFPTVGIEIGCATTDLKCMCSQPSVFEAHMATCMSKNKCSKQEASAGSDLVENICTAMMGNPDSAAIASASSLITLKAPQPTKNAALRMEHGFRLVGVAALGALAL